MNFPWPCLELALTLLWPCLDLASTLPWPFPILASSLHWLCLDLALTLPLNFGPDMYKCHQKNAAWTNVAWPNVTVTVGICSRCSKESTFTVSLSYIEFVWGGLVCKVIFKSNSTKVMLGWGWVQLWLSWGFDNIHPWAPAQASAGWAKPYFGLIRFNFFKIWYNFQTYQLCGHFWNIRKHL